MRLSTIEDNITIYIDVQPHLVEVHGQVLKELLTNCLRRTVLLRSQKLLANIARFQAPLQKRKGAEENISASTGKRKRIDFT